MWYIRLINVAACFRSLGPKVVMIQKMVKEIIFFILIILIFFLAYAISTTGFYFNLHNVIALINFIKSF